MTVARRLNDVLGPFQGQSHTTALLEAVTLFLNDRPVHRVFCGIEHASTTNRSILGITRRIETRAVLDHVGEY